MKNTFLELGLKEALIKAVEKMGFETPTEVQRRAIPLILDRKDVIVRSKTGSGKTGAFSLPILHQIKEDELALILTPTRELALQIDHDMTEMRAFMKLDATVVYGQHNMSKEIDALKTAQIITGTPGRVWDHIQQKNINVGKIKYVVLDEADRMLDMGFFDQVIRIVRKTPEDRLTLLFSATMPPEISKMAKKYMNEPEIVEIESETKTVDTIKQSYYKVERPEKSEIIDRILKFYQPDSCMIFCNTRIAVDKVDIYLKKQGYHSDALHGANTQNSRTRTLQRFKKGDKQILVATDVAARGLHVDDLSLVINFDVPNDKDNYIHRIGRTGRAGNGGIAITLVTKDDLMSLYEIEEHVGVLIDEEEPPTLEAAQEAFEQSEGKWKLRKRYEHREKVSAPRAKTPKTSKGSSKAPVKTKEQSERTNRKVHVESPKKAHVESTKKAQMEGVKKVQKKSLDKAKKPVAKQAQRPVDDKGTESAKTSLYSVKITSTSEYLAQKKAQENQRQTQVTTAESKQKEGLLAKLFSRFKK